MNASQLTTGLTSAKSTTLKFEKLPQRRSAPAALCDALLPKLLSGELRVTDVEKPVVSQFEIYAPLKCLSGYATLKI